MKLAGRLAVVTGAGSGIGAAIAERFAAEGARVLAADVRREAALETAARVDGAITGIEVDVCDEHSIASLMATADEAGGVDLVVNVAGIGSTTTAPDTPIEVWDRVLDVNARGTFLCCKHAVPRMAARGGGAIVNVASIAGLVGVRNRAAYCASKGAVIALTRALAVDHVDEGVRVNCVCPGTVQTPWLERLVEDAGESLEALRARQPMGRLGQPREIASAAVYLASDEAAFVTGSVFVIDGGLTAA